MSEYIIEMKHITKRFPGIVANDDVTLQIKKGEIFALLGENGAGKSTLMSMIFGMYEPDEGEIFIRDKKEQIHSPSYATKLNIGMVHQHFKLVQNYTITENIILGLKKKDKLFGILPYVDLKKADQEIEALSKKYGLEVNPIDVIENTSVSTQQRVEILKMLYREAEILIFDEPTAVLTRVATSRAKPISWVTTTIVMCSSASWRITFNTSPTISGSSAEVGSSKSITSGCIARARTIATRCF